MIILLVAKYFPPANSVASHRLYSFAKYLPQFGITVAVITPQREGNLNYDLNNISVIHPITDSKPVTRYAKVENPLRDLLKYTGIRTLKNYFKSSFYYSSIELLTNMDVQKYDAVLVSYPTVDAIRIGFFVHRFANLPLIVDYRDLWCDNQYDGWTPLDRTIINYLEKRILKNASLVTVATKAFQSRIAERYGIQSKIIFNGYFNSEIEPGHQPLSDGLNICFSGNLYGGKRPIQLVFPFLSSNPVYILHIAVQDPIDIELVKKLSKKYDVTKQVKIYKNISNQESIALQKCSDILLYINRVDGYGTDVIGAKLFEYMPANKFILGIGNKTDEAVTIFKKYNLGSYVSTEHEIAEALNRAKSWNIKNRKDISFFSRKTQAKVLADAIKEAIKNSIAANI